MEAPLCDVVIGGARVQRLYTQCPGVPLVFPHEVVHAPFYWHTLLYVHPQRLIS